LTPFNSIGEFKSRQKSDRLAHLRIFMESKRPMSKPFKKKIINRLKRKLAGVTAGAVTGAVAGSIIFPAVGTGIGAVIGAFGGSTIATVDLVSDLGKRKKSHPEETISERFANVYEDED